MTTNLNRIVLVGFFGLLLPVVGLRWILYNMQKHTNQTPSHSIQVIQKKSIQLQSGSIRILRFSPDGGMLASGNSSGIVTIWNTYTWHLMRNLKVSEGSLYSLAFSPDGRLLASVCAYKPVKLWNPLTGKLTRSIDLSSSHYSAFSTVFSQNGTMLAIGDGDGTISIWSTVTWKQIHTLDQSLFVDRSLAFSPIWEMEFSPDGRWLASAGGADQSKIWSTKNWNALSFGRSERSTSVAFSPNSMMLAVASDKGSVDVWNMNTGRVVSGPIEHAGGAYAVAFSPDGRWLATAGSEAIKLWDTKDWRLAQKIDYKEWVRSLSFAPKGNILAAGDDNGQVTIWEYAPN